jgi:hypothetical protein
LFPSQLLRILDVKLPSLFGLLVERSKLIQLTMDSTPFLEKATIHKIFFPFLNFTHILPVQLLLPQRLQLSLLLLVKLSLPIHFILPLFGLASALFFDPVAIDSNYSSLGVENPLFSLLFEASSPLYGRRFLDVLFGDRLKHDFATKCESWIDVRSWQPRLKQKK